MPRIAIKRLFLPLFSTFSSPFPFITFPFEPARQKVFLDWSKEIFIPPKMKTGFFSTPLLLPSLFLDVINEPACTGTQLNRMAYTTAYT